MEKATFGSGCFWCTEAVFQQINGVEKVQSGYAGGTTENPTYGQVTSGKTGHAEVVQIDFDPSIVTYADILEVFFETHDPTTLNRQGNDVGTQYRSVIFYHSEDQREIAERIKKDYDDSGKWKNPIVTQIEPFTAFYVAEDYHQNYYNLNQNQSYCRFVISPKLQKLKKDFKLRLK